MNLQDALKSIAAEFPAAVVTGQAGNTGIAVAPESLRPLLQMLKEKLGFGYLVFNSAIDRMPENKIDVIYLLCADDDVTRLTVKVTLDRARPEIESVADLFRTADWHEREAAEMFGITFLHHPDPRHLLLWEGFAGFPLRKDFKDDFLIPLPTGKKDE
jgi:NADH:ubiquinone oxidoreductase subunit C